MKIELHMHTSRYSACSANTPEEMLTQLVALGYKAVFLTEHDAVWPEDQWHDLQTQFPQIRIFPGLERTLPNPKGFGHLLILGTTAPGFLDLTDPGDVLARARRQQCPTILAHPYRWEGADEMIAQGYYPDALEYRTPNVLPPQANRAQVTANRLRLPVVNSGDAHSVAFLGQYWIETEEPVETPAQLRQLLLAGRYQNRSSQDAAEDWPGQEFVANKPEDG